MILSLHQARGTGKHKPSHADQAGSFLHIELAKRTKGEYKGGEMRQIPPASARFKQPSPPSSVTSQTKAPLSHFLPFPGKLLPRGPGGLEKATTGTRFGQSRAWQTSSLTKGSLACSWARSTILSRVFPPNKTLTHLQEAL